MTTSLALRNSENIVYQHDITRGFFRRKVIQRLLVTNERVLVQDNENDWPTSQLSLSDIDDIHILNQHSESNSQFNVMSSGPRNSRFMYGNSRSQGGVIGDIVFTSKGVPKIIFKNIQDPNNFVKFMKSLI